MKKLTILCLSLLCAASVSARFNQYRAVVIDTICNTPLHAIRMVADSFCYQFQACPDSLFGWAYLGLEEERDSTKEMTREGRDVFHLQYNDRQYDPKTKTGDVAIDIYVLGARFWKDQHLGTQTHVYHPAHADYPLTVHMTATYSGSIIESGNFLLRMTPISEHKTKLHYEFDLTFGRFLSLFISDKTWSNSIEWRFATILENLVECAETGTVQPKIRGPRPKSSK